MPSSSVAISSDIARLSTHTLSILERGQGRGGGCGTASLSCIAGSFVRLFGFVIVTSAAGGSLAQHFFDRTLLAHQQRPPLPAPQEAAELEIVITRLAPDRAPQVAPEHRRAGQHIRLF